MTVDGSEEKITFASVHDCFWTHAATVDAMNRVLREQFVELYSRPILRIWQRNCGKCIQTLRYLSLSREHCEGKGLSGDKEEIGEEWLVDQSKHDTVK